MPYSLQSDLEQRDEPIEDNHDITDSFFNFFNRFFIAGKDGYVSLSVLQNFRDGKVLCTSLKMMRRNVISNTQRVNLSTAK
jgi:hypothetical protein